VEPNDAPLEQTKKYNPDSEIPVLHLSDNPQKKKHPEKEIAKREYRQEA
jgi:hypothetical protein